ncbi:MAG: choice-of-anchor Q domain-containing protein [Candidatus Thorarchaeota archaeon]
MTFRKWIIQFAIALIILFSTSQIVYSDDVGIDYINEPSTLYGNEEVTFDVFLFNNTGSLYFVKIECYEDSTLLDEGIRAIGTSASIAMNVTLPTGMHTLTFYAYARSASQEEYPSTPTDTLTISNRYFHPKTIYVDGGLTSSGDGESWGTAYTTIQEAVDASYDVDTIWVKEGEYILTSQITVDKDINIYGGFAGDETYLSERNLGNSETVINGDNSVRCLHITDSARIDGFSIKNGFHNEYGGGILINTAGEVKVSNCIISNNTAPYGGGIISLNSTPSISNCIFSSNSATTFGGGLYSYAESSDYITEVVNSIFKQNVADSAGGGVYFYGHIDENTNYLNTIANCTFFQNEASWGGGIIIYDSTLYLINSILWDNVAPSGGHELLTSYSYLFAYYSDIQGGDTEIVTEYSNVYLDDNINADPLFGADLHLQASSPCINEGVTISEIVDDIDDESRPQDGSYDIGADEFLDTDTDSMPDFWEEIYGDLDPTEDEDSDDLNNLEEYVNGTNPNDSDSDDDGLTDSQELENDWDPNDPDSPTSFLFEENFEGVGYDNNLLEDWRELFSTDRDPGVVDPDNAFYLRGTESLFLSSGDNGDYETDARAISPYFPTALNEGWGHFLFKIVDGIGSYGPIFSTSYGAMELETYNNKFKLGVGSNEVISDDDFLANTTYHCWFYYKASDSGSNNGEASVWIGESNTRPSTPLLQISNHSISHLLSIIILWAPTDGSYRHGEAYYDQVIVHDSEFTEVSP